METSYHITAKGLNHALASSSKDTGQLFLLHIIKKHINEPIMLSDIHRFYKDDKTASFKKIFNMIKLELIDVYDQNSSTQIPNTVSNNNPGNDKTIYNIFCNNDFVLSDLIGLPIVYNGFNQHQSINISAIAYDIIKASKRSRYETENNEQLKPLSIKTTINDTNIIIYLLYFGGFSCLLTLKDTNSIEESGLINFASFLCNRYNYD